MRGAALMMVAMAAFTLNDTFMKSITAELPLYQTIVMRGTLTLVLLCAVAPVLGGLRLVVNGADTGRVALRSVAEVGATITFLMALGQMPLANLSAILQSLPLAVTLAAALVFGERFGWRRMTAILLGFVGVLLIIKPGTDGFDSWSIMGLASVACVVVRDLATRRLSPSVRSVTVAFYAALSVTVMAALLSLGQGWAPVGPVQVLSVAAASVLLVAGYVSIVMAMRVGDIAMVAPFRYTSLVWAIFLGWIVFEDLPDGLTLIGAGIVIAMGVYAFYREQRLGRDPKSSGPVPLRVR